jgi:predicted nucleotide-binding protein
VVFIGHGSNAAWRDLKDHLQDKHGFKIEAYETGARAGHTIRDILEEMVTRSSFALLVLTGEDEQPDGQLRARQNVIHEAGLFQGKLGFPRAILLLEDGVEEFSNVHGLQYIKFSKNNIKETYGEVLATLRREFPK